MRRSISQQHVVPTVTGALAMALDYRDHETALHSGRVVMLSQTLGKRLGLAAAEQEDLLLATKFHDVGKVGIPDEVLKKPGKFTTAEWEIMKNHALISGEIVGQMQTKRSATLACIVRHHHEAIDGKGYPDGLKGSAIPLLSRIITVVDCYDAMTTRREYRDCMPHAVVLELMHKEANLKFDADILSVFISLIETSPYKSRS